MSFNSSDDDGQQRFALGFLLILITLVISTVVGVVVYQRGIARTPAGAAQQTAPASTADEASVVVEGDTVRFYFASGKAQLATGARDALAGMALGIRDQGRSIAVSGYHDATGNPEANAELARQRAVAVRDALISLGVPEDKVELRKPELMLGGANDAEARRVEVTFAP